MYNVLKLTSKSAETKALNMGASLFTDGTNVFSYTYDESIYDKSDFETFVLTAEAHEGTYPKIKRRTMFPINGSY